ncbi:M16 family metallopeptidase [Luteolibacter algae]|uniref:M16 family metallopeptidase n=1 Tax=Luteolibacter algae TaxID=454151 RepID=A0ABW5D3F0_9BACT
MDYPLTKATRHTLPNGLTLILDPDPSAPVISVQAWVATGSIHEDKMLGTGLSHFLEHMVFKGTRDFSSDELAQAVQAGGGHWNAYTTFDRTVYYIDGPSHSLETFLKCLTGLVFFPTLPEADFGNEQDVIRREIDMGLDDPDNASIRLLLSTAFTVDARRHPVIGHRHLFDEISHADLVSYHRSRYTPDHTHIVISGDFDAAEARALVIAMTADCKIVSGPEPHIQRDPRQIGPRENTATFDIPTSRLCLSWKTPALDHPDTPAYDILAAILGRGRSSRLYTALRDRRELALEISAWTWNGPDEEGLFAISAEAEPEKRGELKAAILAELADLPASPLDEEIAKAKRQIAISQFRTLTSASGRASDLASNWHEARDLNYTRAYLAEINAVTAADIRRVSQLLTERRLTFTSLDPENFAHTAAVEEKTTTVEPVTTHTLSNGLRIALLPDHRVPLIHLQAAVGAGLLSETPVSNGLNQLLASTLTKGTLSRSAADIALSLETLGASIGASTGNNALLVSASGLAADLVSIIDIFADVIINPSFPSDAIEREKTSQLASLKEAQTDPLHTCFHQVRKTHFAGTGYGLDPLGSLQTLPEISRLDLSAHHALHFNASNTTLAISGDFNSTELIELLETHFSTLPEGEKWAPPASKVNPGKSAETTLPKKQAVLAIAYPGADVSSDDKHALAFINEYASDMAGPLFGRIREELGLAYRVGATQFLGYDQGLFTFYMATSPEQIGLATEELQKEIGKIASQGIPDEAFERVRSTVLSGAAIQQQSSSSNARHAALDLLFGNPADSYLLLPEIYQNLRVETVRETARRIFAVPPTVSTVLGEKA